MTTEQLQAPAVEIRGVTKRYSQGGASRSVLRWTRKQRRRPAQVAQQKLALDNVTLRIETGAITGVLGLNGSGKSTLIRIIATLTLPDEGSAFVFGHNVVSESQAVKRKINRVSVEAAFFKEMSPWENLLYGTRLYGGDSSARPEVEAILSRLGLARATLDRPMKHLSRGQQQKVAIARSFLSSPQLLLMDEPTTGLDPRSKREVQAFVESIRQENGTTVLVSTHDLGEAEELCSRVIMLDRGRILADGTPADLRTTNTVNGNTMSLEDVFLNLTGKTFADDREESDQEEGRA